MLAVSYQASEPIRVDLPAALQLRRQAGGGTLTLAQERALEVFDLCVAQAWCSVSSGPLDPRLMSELAQLVSVLVLDLQGADAGYAQAQLTGFLPSHVEATNVWGLLVEISGGLMTRRGGGDRSSFVAALGGRGIQVDPRPQFREDIDRLRAHSLQVGSSLDRYERIEIKASADQFISIPREFQPAVEAAALAGPLLVIGEPGAGKSGVLNALARGLRDRGQDVLQLAVDRYSVASLQSLSDELGLENSLLEVLRNWEGPETGWLIIDALDATRGGRGEGVFRALIERVQQEATRWRVVASIRTFDLRMGVRFRNLFKGEPPIESLRDSSFSGVRHVLIPRWSDTEFERLLQGVPRLRAALEHASPRLRDLASVPFNTRLLGELISRGVIQGSLNDVASQADLLRLYWEERIESYGLEAEACLSALVTRMVDSRSLKAPSLLQGADPAMVENLAREGVLIRVENDRSVQFRHHVLFDFAAAKTYLEPSGVVSGLTSFPKTQGHGLMLAPALNFLLKEVWDLETDHARFWQAIGNLVSDESGDPLIRSAAGRIGAEHPEHAPDALRLAALVGQGDLKAIATLSHVFGALAIRLEDEQDVGILPWVELAEALAVHVQYVSATLNFVVHLLLPRTDAPALKAKLGLASRALLEHALSLDNANIARSAIGHVVETYSTDSRASRTLLERLFEPGRLERFAAEDIPTLCYKIRLVGDCDPDFVATIYGYVYGFDVTEDRQTQVSVSRILPLRSNARQDYDMARYALSEYLPTFLSSHPVHAAKALADAVNGYVLRQHSHAVRDEYALTIGARTVRLRDDLSHVWAHDPDSKYSHDAEVLVVKFVEWLRAAAEEGARAMAGLVARHASHAILWARLFLVAYERNDGLVDDLWQIAADERFILSLDTTKDAIDLVGRAVRRQPRAAITELEQRALRFDFSAFIDPKRARTKLLSHLFVAIGRDALSSAEAKAILDEEPEAEARQNQRPFRLHTSIGAPGRYFWLEELEQSAPDNAAVIAAIEAATAPIGLDLNTSAEPGLTLNRALELLRAINHELQREDLHAGLRIAAEGAIVKGCAQILALKLLPRETSRSEVEPEVAEFLALLGVATRSLGPPVETDTERRFEESVSWSSPSPRIDAAAVTLDLLLQRPALYVGLQSQINAFLVDPHPAVRLQAVTRLVRIWDVDRAGFWELLRGRLDAESNLGVLEHTVADLLGVLLPHEPETVLDLLTRLLSRNDFEAGRISGVRRVASDQVAALWVRGGFQRAYGYLRPWIERPGIFSTELLRVLHSIAWASVRTQTPDDADRAQWRARARALLDEIVDSANRACEAFYQLSEPTQAQNDEASSCVRLIDTACLQLLSATGAHGGQVSEQGGDALDLPAFLAENGDLLKKLGDNATAHTVYNLLQLFERLVACDPARVFDLTAHALLRSRRSGYQHESLGLDLLVRLMGVFLADHKEIFEDQSRRSRLIESLEVFMDAGWPAARRLLYRLPELVQ